MEQAEIFIETTGRGTYDLGAKVASWIADLGVATGLCHIFIAHTSASLIITENADPDVHKDLETFLSELVPDGDPRYRHDAEGPDDMPAHVRSVLTQTELNVPVVGGRLALGTWQGIYLFEHRTAPHRRRVVLSLLR